MCCVCFFLPHEKKGARWVSSGALLAHTKTRSVPQGTARCPWSMEEPPLHGSGVLPLALEALFGSCD